MVNPSNPYLSHNCWPKEGEIQVLLRAKTVVWVPGMRCRPGMIWMLEEPEPITAMRLEVKS